MASLLLLCCLVAAAAATAPITKRDIPSAIPNEYVVQLKEGSTDIWHTGEVRVIQRFHIGDWRALHIEVAEEHLASLAEDPNIDLIEANTREWHIDQTCTSQTITNTGLWGLGRISSRSNVRTTHRYDTAGSTVNSYILDTGIRSSHTEFGSRVRDGFTAFPPTYTDGNGHGTHVAGTVGGSLTGVAKSTTLINVRVLDNSGSGSTAGVIAGIDYVAGQHTSTARSVINMSLGGGASTTMDNALANAISRGVTAVVAAGNSNANACNYSPARVSTAITVGATTNTDARASYSNFGTCVDIFAPGSNVYSAWHTSNTAYNTISGTSMASPHVAGWAARYLQGVNASPAAVMSAMISQSTPNVVSNPGTGSPNRLLFSACAGDG